MTLEVGTSVQKVIAMILAAAGGFYLLQNGHSDAAIAIFTGIGVYAFGEANGKRIERNTQEPEELSLHRL